MKNKNNFKIPSLNNTDMPLEKKYWDLMQYASEKGLVMQLSRYSTKKKVVVKMFDSFNPPFKKVYGAINKDFSVDDFYRTYTFVDEYTPDINFLKRVKINKELGLKEILFRKF